MKENKCEGIVLKSYAFKEKERIIHLFTPDHGVIHLIAKHLSPKKPHRLNLTTPLCEGSYIFRKGKSHLYSLIDGSIFTLHLPLRQSLENLNLGGKMVRAVHATQLPEKPAPKLYYLLSAYLKKLPLAPESIWTSFQLKLLKHEGRLLLEKPRVKLAETSYIWTNEEWNYLTLLSEGRNFSTLTAFTPPQSFQKRVDTLFSSFLKT